MGSIDKESSANATVSSPEAQRPSTQEPSGCVNRYRALRNIAAYLAFATLLILIGAHFWGWATSRELFAIRTESRIECLCFSPDGKYLATGTDYANRPSRPEPSRSRLVRQQCVIVWDASSGQELYSLGGIGQAWGVAFSPDGKSLAAATSGGFSVWDLAVAGPLALKHEEKVLEINKKGGGECQEVWSLQAFEVPPDREANVEWGCQRIAFSPDNKRLATMRSGIFGPNSVPEKERVEKKGCAKVWDTATGQELLHIVLDNYWSGSHTDSVAFSPDEKWLATAITVLDCAVVRVWDASTGEEIVATRGNGEPHSNTVLSPDRGLVASGVGNTVSVWDSRTGEERLALKGHSGSIRTIAFSPDGTRLVSYSEDGTAKMWNIAQ